MANKPPWPSEPDDLIYADPATWARCRILRHPDHGALLGYIALPREHCCAGHPPPMLSEENPLVALEVHGGITFSDGTFPSWAPQSEEEVEGLWIIGFSCDHHLDMAPGRSQVGEYRTVEYVKKELADLARQLKDIDPVII